MTMIKSDNVKNIYENKHVSKYNRSISHLNIAKKKTINRSNLKSGDNVIVFCCGTGLDFPHIQEKIGQIGKITGLDFSKNMLEEAKKLIDKKGWKNIELVEQDILKMDSKYDSFFDAAICTLGLSIIPNYKLAYKNIYSSVKKGGQIIIGDMKLGEGFKAIFNPLTVHIAKGFGGTFEGHKNTLELKNIMKVELKNIIEKEFMLGSYFYIIGEK